MILNTLLINYPKPVQNLVVIPPLSQNWPLDNELFSLFHKPFKIFKQIKKWESFSHTPFFHEHLIWAKCRSPLRIYPINMYLISCSPIMFQTLNNPLQKESLVNWATSFCYKQFMWFIFFNLPYVSCLAHFIMCAPHITTIELDFEKQFQFKAFSSCHSAYDLSSSCQSGSITYSSILLKTNNVFIQSNKSNFKDQTKAWPVG